MKINFYLRDNSAKAETPIMLYVRAGKTEKGTRNTIKIPTGLNILPKNWNKNSQSPKRGVNSESYINQKLSAIRATASELWTKTTTEYSVIDLKNYEAQLRNCLSITVKKSSTLQGPEGFYPCLNKYIETIQSDLSKSTVEKYQNLRRHLIAFSDNLSFESIDLNFYDSIKSIWLTQNKLSNTTINKNLKLLKTFMQWAVERKLTDNTEYTLFKPLKQHEPNVIALSKEEFERIYNLKIISIHLKQVRDVFCFACLTGQRWSDISRIEHDDLEEDTWILTQEKTKKKIRIPLLKEAKAILKKYKNGVKPLPIISEQKTNQHLKDIGVLAELTDIITKDVLRGNTLEKIKKTKAEFLSTHISRKSFITISLSLGMNPIDVMSITGHSTFAAMKPYIRVTETQKRKALTNAWENNVSA